MSLPHTPLVTLGLDPRVQGSHAQFYQTEQLRFLTLGPRIKSEDDSCVLCGTCAHRLYPSSSQLSQHDFANARTRPM